MNKCKFIIIIVILVQLVFTTACITRELPAIETYYETEHKTEYKTETYTEIENVIVSTQKGKKYLDPIVEWHDRLSFGTAGTTDSTYYYGYSLYDWDFNPLEHSKIQVKISISRLAQQQKGTILIYDITGLRQIAPMPTYLGYDSGYSHTWWFNTILVPTLSTAHIVGELHTGIGEKDYITFDAKEMTDFAILVNSYSYYTISSAELTWSDDVIEQKTIIKQREVPYQTSVQVQKQRRITKTEKVPVWEIFWDE